MKIGKVMVVSILCAAVRSYLSINFVLLNTLSADEGIQGSKISRHTAILIVIQRNYSMTRHSNSSLTMGTWCWTPNTWTLCLSNPPKKFWTPEQMRVLTLLMLLFLCIHVSCLSRPSRTKILRNFQTKICISCTQFPQAQNICVLVHLMTKTVSIASCCTNQLTHPADLSF